ncbi:unnamed protein product, partial [marine sediment metagenome]
MIDLLGQLYITGIINRKGKFNTDLNSPYVVIDKVNPYYIIAKAEETATKKDIVISEIDIDNLIRAKGAIYAGITTLLEEVGLTKDNLEQIFIAGGFGHFINVKNAIIIGMLPDLPEEIFTFLGNTSVAGAHLALINRDKWKEMEKISRNITYIELFNNNKFYERYIASLFLPYTHIEVPVMEIEEASIQEGLLARDTMKLEPTEKVLAGIKRLDIRDVKILPRVVKRLITVELPLIGRSSSDKYRLEIALKQQLGLEDCFIPLEILKKLPDTLRKGKWTITVTLDEISKDLIDI